MVELICDIGSNFRGSVELGKELIDECKELGVTPKFQLWKTEKIYSKGDWEYYKQFELSFDMAKELFKYGKSIDVDVFFSVFDEQRVEWTERIGTKRIKVAARSVNDMPLLEKIAETGKPTIISLTRDTLDRQEKLTDLFGRDKVKFLFCIPEYPTPLDHIKINDISQLFNGKNMFRNKIHGFSSHAVSITPAQTFIAMGAEIIEVHMMLFGDRQASPDGCCSLMADDIRRLVQFANEYEQINR